MCILSAEETSFSKILGGLDYHTKPWGTPSSFRQVNKIDISFCQLCAGDGMHESYETINIHNSECKHHTFLSTILDIISKFDDFVKIGN